MNYTFSLFFVIQNLNLSQDRCEELNLKGETLDQDHSEPLEEILKRVQFNKIDFEGTSLNDEVFLQKMCMDYYFRYILQVQLYFHFIE